MEIDKMIGAEMRRQREARHLSLEEVASRMGYMSRNTPSLMELGKTKITLGMMVDFCKAVGCDLEPFVEIIENARLQR